MKYSILFCTDAIPNSDECRLRCRVTWNGKSCSFNTGDKVERSKWNPDTQRCLRGSYHGKYKVSYSIINNHLQSIENAIVDLFNSVDCPTKDQIRTSVGKDKPEKDRTLLVDVFEDFIKSDGKKRQWSNSSVRIYNSVLLHISNVLKKKSISDFCSEDIDAIITSLFDVGLKNLSITVYLSKIKRFITWAYDNGYNVDVSLLKYKAFIKKAPRKVIFLTEEELKSFMEYKCKGKYEIARDIYVFCCYTSLRISDAMNLKTCEIGAKSFTFITQKTSDMLTIDLNTHSRSIIDKYYVRDNVYLFPRLSITYYNRAISSIAKSCGICDLISYTEYRGGRRVDVTRPKYELITSHSARRTFISHAIMKGIPVPTIMKWTGHKDYDTMKAYIDICDKERKDAMKLFDD